MEQYQEIVGDHRAYRNYFQKKLLAVTPCTMIALPKKWKGYGKF
jgi:hypothetical protein